MNKEQQAAFSAAVTDAIVTRGTPVGEGSTEYGWIAGDYQELREHMTSCQPDYPACAWGDSSWSEFTGTFDPPAD